MVNYLVKQAKELIALWQVNSNPYNILVHIVCVCVCLCVRACVCVLMSTPRLPVNKAHHKFLPKTYIAIFTCSTLLERWECFIQ